MRAARQAEWLLSRFPVTAKDVSVPLDGDQARPLELITGLFYSRRQIDRELSYYVPIGTPALIHDVKAKGSTLGPKTMWGVAIGMYREAVIFWLPHTNSIRQSKSFTAYKLRQSMNYAQFLNLPSIPSTQKSTAIPDDFTEHIVIQLPATQSAENTQPAPIQKVKCVSEELTQHQAKQSEIPIISTTTHPAPELRGSVHVKDATGTKLTIDPETGYLESAHLEPETGADYQDQLEHRRRPTLSTQPSTKAGKLPYVKISNSKSVQKLWDEHDLRQQNKTAIVTRASDTFNQICKQHKIPFEHHEQYRHWLMRTQKNSAGGKLTPDQLPTTRGQRLPPHLKLPRPSGSLWQRIKDAKKTNRDIDNMNDKATAAATAHVHSMHWLQKHSFRATGALNFEFNLPQNDVSTACAAKKKRRVNLTNEPANTRDALEHPKHSKQWSESMDEEINGLTKMGVLDHGYTQKDLHNMGITSRPIPLGLYHTHKTDKAGAVNRLKTRAAVQGHKGNMQKGVHYTDTFAPTPSEDTTRFLCCLTVLLNLKRLCGDIEKAYCWADVPAGELIALSYPEGYKRVNGQGSETFMIMRKNLYGHPAAARAWTAERDDKMLSHFNTNGWTCKQTTMDPCLFAFTDSRGKRAWVLIHTDDCDGAGEDDEILEAIFSKLNDIWSVKIVDDEYMLGVTRSITYKQQTGQHSAIESIECTMTPFVEAMIQSFGTHLPTTTVSTPFPEHAKLSKYDEVSEEEHKDVIALGYQRVVGMLMWAARHCYPECKYGVSRLCSVMARPTYRAFKAAMHVVTYLSQHNHRGIRFSIEGNRLPIALSDASNKPDPQDELCQAGFAVMWLGGPMATQSKKLKHIGLSSEHNEYMAITSVVKRVIWLRQLIFELGIYPEILAHPTLVLGDNTQANRLCKEHFISTGNQYIYLPYHFNKEATHMGFVAIKWLRSKLNISDLFTKAVPRQVFEALVGGLTGYDGPEHLARILEEMH